MTTGELFFTLNPDLEALSCVKSLRRPEDRTTANAVKKPDIPVVSTSDTNKHTDKDSTKDADTAKAVNGDSVPKVTLTVDPDSGPPAAAAEGDKTANSATTPQAQQTLNGVSVNVHSESSDAPHGLPQTLQYDWVIWEQLQANHYCGASDYKQTTREIATFSTVEEFWSLFEQLPQPSELLAHKKMVRVDDDDGRKPIDAIMIFKSGVAPMWEDPVNSCGGHFEYRIPAGTHLPLADEYWNALLLSLIGGTIKHSDIITGVRLVDKMERKTLRVELWFTDYSESVKREELKKNAAEMMATKLDGTVGTILDCTEKSHKRK
eukprot:Lankesteria_metandrocarpae@DN2553_c0_g1_i2.p1